MPQSAAFPEVTVNSVCLPEWPDLWFSVSLEVSGKVFLR